MPTDPPEMSDAEKLEELKRRLLAEQIIGERAEGAPRLSSVLINPDGPDAVAAIAALEAENARLREGLERIDQFITAYREPWGSWKTAWWEGEVSDDAAFSADNALMHVANIARQSLGEPKP